MDALRPLRSLPAGFAAAVARSALAGAAGGQLANGTSVYLPASLINLSCHPCAEVRHPDVDYIAEVAATRDVDAGEEVTIACVDVGLGVGERRRRLAEGYGFWCACAKCAEEEEAGDARAA